MYEFIQFYREFYWLFVLAGTFIGVLVTTMYFATGKWADTMNWLEKHTTTAYGEDFSQFFVTLGAILAPAIIAFANVWVLPVLLAFVLGLLFSVRARQRRAVLKTMERNR